MTNRLTRDEILMRALDMVDALSLDQKERPGGNINQNAMCISWLQDALDLFHRVFPWTGIVKKAAVSFTTGQDTYSLPSDFSLDVRDGLRIMQTSPQAKRRLHRKSLNWFLNRDTTTDATGVPREYVILTPNFQIWPHSDGNYTGELWYYSLPTVLTANTKPNFPDDWTLVEYVRLRAKEWTGEAQPGAAMAYAEGVIAKLREAGVGVEADNDRLELDPDNFRPSGNDAYAANSWSWMGDATPR